LPPPVNSYPIGTTDPVFDPIAAGVVKNLDTNLAAAQVQEMFNGGTTLASAWSGEFSLIRSVLFDYPLGTTPPPPTPQYCPSSSTTPCVDPTAQSIPLTANLPEPSGPEYYTGAIINEGGLGTTIDAADPFVMQYADGLETAWGQLSLDQISQQTRIVGIHFNIEMRSPYLAQVQSSNAASHVLRTMQQAVNGVNLRGAFGNARSRTVVVISSDAYVAGLAGLLNLHWQLPEYQPDFCAPGGALVFELRQSASKQYFVRVFYTAQTLDQLRSLTKLTLGQTPGTMQLPVPGGSNSATDFDVNFGVFQKLMMNAIGQQYVEPLTDVPPDVLSGGVTCQPEPGCPE
jgi:4-phytase/acid phosphatase